MATQSSPPPFRDRVVDAAGRLTQSWLEFFASVSQAIDLAPSRTTRVLLTGQGAAIGTTPIPAGSLSSGSYRVSVFARITRAATTSSSVQPSLAWTEGGVSCSETWAAMTGNTTATVLTGPAKTIRIDAATPISYAVAYASVGGTSAQYELSLVLERLDA